jgi:hypothetical protein
MNTKDIADLFFDNLGKALSKTRYYGFNEPTELAFKDYPRKITEEIVNDLNKFYNQLIDKYEGLGISRENIIHSCASMSIEVHNFLQEKNIPSLIVIGDMKIHGEKEYNTTHEYLERELKGLENGTIHYHVWVVTENFLLIDPTFRLKEGERSDFIAKKSKAGLFICDLENFTKDIEYIPMLVGKDFIYKTNSVAPYLCQPS